MGNLSLLLWVWLLPAAAGRAQSSSPPAVQAIYHLDLDREQVVSLDGGWRFHPGDDPAWASPEYDDSAWAVLRADQPWSRQGYANLSGFGWYRFTLEIPAQHPPLALEFAPTMTAYRLYLDGKPAGEAGSRAGSMIPSAIWDYQLFSVPTPSDGRAHRLHVALRVWQSPIWSSYIGGGPQTSGNLFGSSRLLQIELGHHRATHRLLFVDLFAYAIAAAIIALTVFRLFSFRPGEVEYLWFGLVILAKAVDAALNISKELYAVPSIPIYDLLDGLCIAAAQVALMLFLARVSGLRRNWLWRIPAAMAALSPLLEMLYWPGWLTVPVAGTLQIFFLLPSSIWMLSVLTAGALRRHATARLLILPVFLIQGFWIADNVVVALAQFGVHIEARSLEAPLMLPPYEVHPAVVAELLFLLAMLVFLIRRFTSARQREERLESELEAARQVQQVVLPVKIGATAGFAVESIYHPADIVGGDFFQILPLPDDGLLVVAGDVAGKGLPAALMVSMLIGAVRAEACHTVEPGALLYALNECSHGHLAGKFTTCIALHIDRDGEMAVANAGHLYPYLDGEELVTEPALPLGIVRNLSYRSARFRLRPGARLVLLSDGVVEARSRDGELYGFERTRALSHLPAAAIAEAARSFGQDDDITVLTITYLGQGPVAKAEEGAPLQAELR